MLNPQVAHALGLSPEKCRQRNWLEARRGVVTVTIQLAGRSAPPSTAKGATLEFARGSLPTSDEARLERINSMLPNPSKPLHLEKVLLLPTVEVANSNLASDRGMFLGSSTLRNIAADASLGFAFMNSHNRGHMSTPGQLPYGKTYAGRYERFSQAEGEPRRFERALADVYMLSGTFPTGSQGPSADDLYAMVMGGVIPDASVGLGDGVALCDLCGLDIDDRDCPHIPNTSRDVTQEQKKSQEARGVPRGVSTFTYEEGRPGEVSSVYDGAIPGAGFNKAMEFAKSGKIGPSILDEFMAVYSHLLTEGDKRAMDPQARKGNFFNVLRGKTASSQAEAPAEITEIDGFRFVSVSPDGGAVIELDPPEMEPVTLSVQEPVATTLPVRPVTASKIEMLERQVQAQEQELRAHRERLAKARISAATAMVDGFIEDEQLLPAGRNAAIVLANILMAEGEPVPELLEYKDATGRAIQCSPSELFTRMMSDAPQHSLLKEQPVTSLPEGAILLRGTYDPKTDVQEAIDEAKADAQKLAGKAPKSSKNGNHPE